MTDLPVDTLSVFPVQHFTHRQLWEVARRETTGNPDHDAGTIFFGNSFANPRPQAGAPTLDHNAIDIMAPRGLPIFSTTRGVVPPSWRPSSVLRPGVGTESDPAGNDGGNYVVIVAEGTGQYHYYAHFTDRPLVAIGDTVHAGQLLGFVGNTGRARGGPYHLHYQVTTRTERGGARIFWNPYAELVRLAGMLGRGGTRRVEIQFDDFLTAVCNRDGAGLVDPWTGRARPMMRYPWDDGLQ